jgi:streptomycin 6-kinase
MAERWTLTVGPPFEPGGVAAWVAPARAGDGTPLVLKIGWRHAEAEHEADGLRIWDGDGAVRLIDSHVVGGDTIALLLEACQPGTPLSRLLPRPDQDVIVAGLLRGLWVEPQGTHPFRPLQSLCDLWADEVDSDGVGAQAAPRTALDPGLLRAGVALFRSLPAGTPRSVLLCTDLHPGNVLASTREPWLAIDPKPYVGDPTYDALQHMINFPDRLAADPLGFVARMAGLLDLDAGRLRLWLFARCAVASFGAFGQPSLAAVARAVAP